MPAQPEMSEARTGIDADAGPLLFLRERFLWMGKHSGYDRLFGELERDWPGVVESVQRTRSPLKNAFFQPLAFLTRPRTPWYNGDSIAAELAALRRARHARSALVHVAYVENNLRLFATRPRERGMRLVGTAHQPSGWWRSAHRHPELVSALDALIVLCRSQRDYFEEALPGSVHCIPHGVDTVFFSPAPVSEAPHPERDPRCVFGGLWQRDLVSLRRVIDEVLSRRTRMRFDLIVPRRGRGHPELARIARHDRVAWHENVTNERLREIYRAAHVLVLPLIESTANNTLLEALACGLPVVTTDVGGVPDYTDPSFATCLAAGDASGVADAVLRLTDDPVEARARGLRARAFAERHLDWRGVAAATLKLYRRLLN